MALLYAPIVNKHINHPAAAMTSKKTKRSNEKERVKKHQKRSYSSSREYLSKEVDARSRANTDGQKDLISKLRRRISMERDNHKAQSAMELGTTEEQRHRQRARSYTHSEGFSPKRSRSRQRLSAAASTELNNNNNSSADEENDEDGASSQSEIDEEFELLSNRLQLSSLRPRLVSEPGRDKRPDLRRLLAYKRLLEYQHEEQKTNGLNRRQRTPWKPPQATSSTNTGEAQVTTKEEYHHRRRLSRIRSISSDGINVLDVEEETTTTVTSTSSGRDRPQGDGGMFQRIKHHFQRLTTTNSRSAGNSPVSEDDGITAEIYTFTAVP